MDAAPDSLIGRTLDGKFRLEALLGQGAMGAVYRARQVALDKTIAVKVMHPAFAADPRFVERFQREARAASRLDHPNSVHMIDVGREPDGLLYIAMEFLEGRDLAHVLHEDWPLPGERIIDLLSQVLAALTAAHEAGVVHRDLKPENIMVAVRAGDDGEARDHVKVCDFGIATLGESPRGNAAGRRLTASGVMVGTPEYMSPEQARGEPVDARSDVYAVGVMLYEMLTGRVPFEGETAMVALRHVTDEPMPVLEAAPHADPGLATVCEAAMRKRREDRIPSARAFRAALRSLRGAPPSEAPASWGPPASFGPVTLPPPLRHVAPTQAEAHAGTQASMPIVTATQPSPPASRRAAWWAAAAVAALGAAAIAFVLPRAHTVPPAASVVVSATHAEPNAREAPPEPTAAPSAERTTAPVPTPAKADVRAPVSTFGKRSDPSPPPVSAPTGAPEPAAPTVVIPVAPPPATEAPPSAPPTVVAPAPPPFDASTGTVSLGGVTSSGGVATASARRVVPRGSLMACYQTALRAHGAASGGSVTVHLVVDDTGRVTSVAASGADFLSGLRGCVEGAFRGLRIPNVDTGDGTADVTLVFAS